MINNNNRRVSFAFCASACTRAYFILGFFVWVFCGDVHEPPCGKPFFMSVLKTFSPPWMPHNFKEFFLKKKSKKERAV